MPAQKIEFWHFWSFLKLSGLGSAWASVANNSFETERMKKEAAAAAAEDGWC